MSELDSSHSTDSAPDTGLDARQVVAYLVRPEADSYIAVMDILESSVNDLSAAEVTAAIAAAGRLLPRAEVEARLDALVDLGAVSARSDTSRARRYVEILARNWRYTASPAGRQVHRFYRTVLAGTPVAREIPIVSLNQMVSNLEQLAQWHTHLTDTESRSAAATVEAINAVFTGHDDLDSALVGAEDAIIGLADRFDLDDAGTAELKGLLLDYATRVADELDRGSARAAAAMAVLAPYFPRLAETAVAASRAKDLISAGALTASRGGRVEDWEGLAAWFDARAGRAARFSMRLVRTLPSMHANLRRLHSSVGAASSRSRALALAKAVLTPEIGVQIFQAALGDHSWRKLSGESGEDDVGRNPSWRSGPKVAVPPLLRTNVRSGPRGRGSAPRDDRHARVEVAAARARRERERERAVDAVLAAMPGQVLDESAARFALAALMAAARARPRGATRTASSAGLACTLVHTGTDCGILAAPTWTVTLPGRLPLFHLPGQRPSPAMLAAVRATPVPPDRAAPVSVHITAGQTPSGPAEKESAGAASRPIQHESGAA